MRSSHICIFNNSGLQAEDILNTKSGWCALAGTTDFAAVTAQRVTHPGAALAFNLFVDRILNYVGAYYLKLGGEVDALVFAGGVGERSVELREAVVRQCACLGFSVDEERNRGVDGSRGKVVDLGRKRESRSEDAGKRVLMCRTDEQVSFTASDLSSRLREALMRLCPCTVGDGARVRARNDILGVGSCIL